MSVRDLNKPVVMTITLERNGELTIDGPVHDKAFCLALLDEARQAVKDHGKVQHSLFIPGGIKKAN